MKSSKASLCDAFFVLSMYYIIYLMYVVVNIVMEKKMTVIKYRFCKYFPELDSVGNTGEAK